MVGLLGILRSGEIWTSHIRYLNDASEQEHLWCLLETRTKSRLLIEQDPVVKQSCESLLSSIRSRSNRDRYVASFSSDGDLLSQWLSYCPSGIGFSIGFKRDPMLGLPQDRDFTKAKIRDNVSLSPVLYMLPDDAALLDRFIDIFVGRELPDMPKMPTIGHPLLDAMFSPGVLTIGLLTNLECRVKDASFSAEKEYRLILDGDDNVQFRAGKSMLIPYRTYDFRTEYSKGIDKIIVGPCPNPKMSRDSLQKQLDVLGYSGVEIATSAIPYRNW